MPRKPDHSPVNNTCPLIDEVIAILDKIDTEDKSEIREANELMEKIRDANSTLREWGNGQYEDREAAEESEERKSRDLADAEEKIAELEQEIEDLKAQINQ